MKLDDYAISSALLDGDWSGAVAALAQHCGIVMPAEYRLDVMRDAAFVPEVEIFYHDRVLTWTAGAGIRNLHRSYGYSTPIVADIYVPPRRA